MINDYFAVLEAYKFRLTPQRLGVYDVLAREKKHLTAEEIYGKIRKRFPAISLATVYTIVELYKTKGLVQEIRVDAHKSRFELRSTPHHHFVCRMCHRIMDIELAPCPALHHGEVQGHKIEELHGYFFGMCKLCRHDATGENT